jgi:hypothetical protein
MTRVHRRRISESAPAAIGPGFRNVKPVGHAYMQTWCSRNIFNAFFRVAFDVDKSIEDALIIHRNDERIA